jgi:endo-1,4-beta-xylanase
VARHANLVFGTAGGEELAADPDYQQLVFRQAALLTPENALKFGNLQPAEGQFDFTRADDLIDETRRHGLQVHGHTLFWNDWPPPWLKGLSSIEIERVFETYCERVVPHFAGRLVSWDVVNEPFWLGRDRPGAYRPGPWFDALGPTYIFEAFRRVASLDPHVTLVLNEAWTERTDPVGLAVRRSLLRLIDEIQHRGIKLDAIGLQSHLTPNVPYDDASFTDFLHEIAARGLAIYISEFDVDDEGFAEDVTQRDQQVAQRTRAFLDAVLKVASVRRVVTWGLSDRYSWWRSPGVMAAHGWTRLARPLPYDDLLARKPMWHAMVEAFAHRAP